VSHDELEGQILEYLALNGWLAWRTHGPRTRPINLGIPDIMAVRDGQHAAVEVKIPPDKLSEKQAKWLTDLAEHGSIICVATKLEDVYSFARR